MLKLLLILLLLCLLAGYIGYRVLRFLTRIAQTVSGIHEEGQRPRDPFSGDPPYSGRPGGLSREKDITERVRIIEEKPGRDG
ncbi:MAG: hypothetical protein NXI24_02940 [bacterium]|nr:hypothetical protein [bacterium]